jgi:two-component system chemotaxis response regulator CheY
MPDKPARILLVGHCGPDSYALRSAVGTMIPGAAVEFASDQTALDKQVTQADLLLVNRSLDGDFPADDGVELIRSLAERGAVPRMMLISNYPDAQAEAQAAGALPGFGKRDMYSDETKRRLRTALGLD